MQRIELSCIVHHHVTTAALTGRHAVLGDALLSLLMSCNKRQGSHCSRIAGLRWMVMMSRCCCLRLLQASQTLAILTGAAMNQQP